MSYRSEQSSSIQLLYVWCCVSPAARTNIAPAPYRPFSLPWVRQDGKIQPPALCGGTRSVFGADSAEKRCSCSRLIQSKRQLSAPTFIYWALLRFGSLSAPARVCPAGISVRVPASNLRVSVFSLLKFFTNFIFRKVLAVLFDVPAHSGSC